MDNLVIREKDEVTMKLLHYFITEAGYSPIIIHGIKDEIWLENMHAPYEIIRIMSGHIHNSEQLEFDLYKTSNLVSHIKKKTLRLKVKTLSIFMDIEEDVPLKSENNIDCININTEEDIPRDNKIKEAFPSIGSKLDLGEKGVELFVKITNDINEVNEREAKKTEAVFSEKKPIVTYALIALNVLVFIAMYLFGNGSEDNLTLIKFGALVGDLVKDGEIYRLITSSFIHIGIVHILFNMYALYVIGPQIENFYGHFKYLFIYLFSAIAGALLSISFNTDVISAGASGAIFGLLGSIAYFGYHYRVYLGNALRSQIIPIIILNLFIGFMIAGIDQFAHLGGLVGGIVISMAMGVPYKSGKTEQTNGIIISILLIAFLVYVAFVYTH